MTKKLHVKKGLGGCVCLCWNLSAQTVTDYNKLLSDISLHSEMSAGRRFWYPFKQQVCGCPFKEPKQKRVNDVQTDMRLELFRPEDTDRPPRRWRWYLVWKRGAAVKRASCWSEFIDHSQSEFSELHYFCRLKLFWNIKLKCFVLYLDSVFKCFQ